MTPVATDPTAGAMVGDVVWRYSPIQVFQSLGQGPPDACLWCMLCRLLPAASSCMFFHALIFECTMTLLVLLTDVRLWPHVVVESWPPNLLSSLILDPSLIVLMQSLLRIRDGGEAAQYPLILNWCIYSFNIHFVLASKSSKVPGGSGTSSYIWPKPPFVPAPVWPCHNRWILILRKTEKMYTHVT